MPFDAHYEEKGKRMNWKRTARWSWLILPFLLLALWPGAAAADDDHKKRKPRPCTKLEANQACLYEVTEEAVFVDADFNPIDPTKVPPAFRVATAAIMGTTGPGGAACPLPVPCSVVAHGMSVISLTGDPFSNPNFGQGTFEGTLSFVVNETGTVDGEEVVFATGAISGGINLLPAILYRLGLGGAPLGSLQGLWCLGSGCTPNRPLTGTFRLPFTSEGALKNLLKHSFNLPRKGVQPAFYLLDDGRRVHVLFSERSLGDPTVRLEATFE